METSIKELMEEYVRREAETLQRQMEQQAARQKAECDRLREAITWSGVGDVLRLGPVAWTAEAKRAIATGEILLPWVGVTARTMAELSQQNEVCVLLDAGKERGLAVSRRFPAIRFEETLPGSVRSVVGEMTVRLVRMIEEERHREKKNEEWAKARAAEKAEALERGRRGAEILLGWAREWNEISALQEEALRAWAEEWTDRLWHAWSVWRIRYVPVGKWPASGEEEFGLIEECHVLDDPDDIAASSPGARVQVVDWRGGVRERVIGAFLDAELVGYPLANLHEALPHHTSTTAWSQRGNWVVNVPAGEEQTPPWPPTGVSWVDFLESKGMAVIGSEMGLAPEQLARMSIDEIAMRYEVQQLADLEGI
ncbi:MAG: hypothetical protein NAOJABEB_03289 [Steroidobacteraceae bacterium]|nr:hypothetical protein [Steroidobacteraceae bacterium]